MNLRDLEYVVAVAEQGHFGRAAEQCCITQPTLSAQIRKLEQQLGITIFERAGRRVLPTDVGERFITNARRVLEAAEALTSLSAGECKPLAGEFRLGVIPTLGPYLLPQVIPLLRERYPDLRLFLREERTEPLLESLRLGRLDAALLALPVEGDDLVFETVFQEPFVAAVPKDHPLARRPQVTVDALERAGLLLLEEGHCLRGQALAVCGDHSHRERDGFAATSLETLRQMVAVGMGCTLLPWLASRNGGTAGDIVTIRPLPEPSPARTLALVWRRTVPDDTSVRALAACLTEAYAALKPPRVRIKNGAGQDEPGVAQDLGAGDS